MQQLYKLEQLESMDRRILREVIMRSVDTKRFTLKDVARILLGISDENLICLAAQFLRKSCNDLVNEQRLRIVGRAHGNFNLYEKVIL